MKVCQYVPHGAIPDIRGFAPAIVAQNTVKSFKDNNIDYFFVSNLEDYKAKHEYIEIGEVFRIGHSKIYNRLFKKITRLDPNPLYKQLANILNREKVDILHVHQLEFPVNKFKKLLNYDIKIIIRAPALRTFYKKRGVADCYIAVSQYTKNKMVKERGFPKDKVRVVYNGVDTSLFFKTEEEVLNLKKLFKIPINNIVISYIGRKQEAKGFFVSLQVFEKILNNFDNITMFCVGSTPKDVIKDTHYKEEQILLEKLKHHQNFINLDALPHNELSKIYKMTDILLFPTFFKGEQHPLVSLEALAARNILITSTTNSIPEYIKDNHNGFLVKNPQNMKEVLDKTLYVINNLKNLDYIKENAIKTSNQFDWKNISNQLISIYKDILRA